MLTRRVAFFAISVLLVTVGALPLSADTTQTFLLEGSNASLCSSAAPCAQVTVDVNNAGNTATFTVSSLLNGYVFDSFGFNSSATVALVAGSGTGELGTYSLTGPGSITEDGWGKFDYEFDTGKTGGSNGGDCVVTSGSPGTGCTFSFVVSGTGLTVTDFEVASSGDSGSTDFVGHMANGANSGGYAGDAVAPEPTSLVLFGSGLLGVGLVLRRRLRIRYRFLMSKLGLPRCGLQ